MTPRSASFREKFRLRRAVVPVRGAGAAGIVAQRASSQAPCGPRLSPHAMIAVPEGGVRGARSGVRLRRPGWTRVAARVMFGEIDNRSRTARPTCSRGTVRQRAGGEVGLNASIRSGLRLWPNRVRRRESAFSGRSRVGSATR
jgi:hypothetical protein